MFRIKKGYLKTQLRILSEITGIEYDIDYAYGGVRLVSKDGSRDISLRCTKRELYDQLWTTINVLRESKYEQNNKEC